jgi:hypothetical protein
VGPGVIQVRALEYGFPSLPRGQVAQDPQAVSLAEITTVRWVTVKTGEGEFVGLHHREGDSQGSGGALGPFEFPRRHQR